MTQMVTHPGSRHREQHLGCRRLVWIWTCESIRSLPRTRLLSSRAIPLKTIETRSHRGHLARATYSTEGMGQETSQRIAETGATLGRTSQIYLEAPSVTSATTWARVKTSRCPTKSLNPYASWPSKAEPSKTASTASWSAYLPCIRSASRWF